MQCGENLLRFEPYLDTPAGGLAAWWRIETWVREGGISWIPAPGRRSAGQGRASPGVPPDRGALNTSELSENHACLILFSFRRM